MPARRRSSVALLATLLAVGACTDVAAPVGRELTGGVSLSKGGGGGGGSGGGTAIDGSNFLPKTPPSPDILLYESFGQASNLRPAGDKGVMKDAVLHTTIGGFWVEYPGSRNTQWLAPNTGQTWKFAGCSDNPLQLPSPLETQYQGCVVSEWFDPPTSFPTALMPITVALPSTGYELSMEGYPAPALVPGAYVAIGFTGSGVLQSNLTSGGSLWLRVTNPTSNAGPLHYELRTGSLTGGQLLASGDAGYAGYNPMALRYSPAAGTVTLSFGGAVIGTYPVSIAAPKYVAFEGIGVLDDLVLRK